MAVMQSTCADSSDASGPVTRATTALDVDCTRRRHNKAMPRASFEWQRGRSIRRGLSLVSECYG